MVSTLDVIKKGRAFVLLLVCVAKVYAADTPHLVVIVVGDQVRADYLERFHDSLGPDGLRRFRDEGTYFTHARRDDAVTKTSPGHVLIGSGLYASQSGIIDNDWYDRTQERVVVPTELIPNGAHTQLRWFRGTSLAARLHETYTDLRFVSVSLKDRAALLLGGPDQDEAYWWDGSLKKWVSYHSAPEWLTAFNAGQAGHSDAYKGMEADDATEKLAEEILTQWQLGHNPIVNEPDVLTVSFSAVDLVGHRFGPDSEEVKAAFLNLDKNVAKLMAAVNSEAGDSVLWVFSSDHGVTPLPEVSTAQGLDAHRVALSLKTLPYAKSIEAVHPPWIYLKSMEHESAIERAILKMPGVAAVYHREDLLAKKGPPELLRSFDKDRCGDLWVVLKPKSIFSEGTTGTTHGQPTDDDQEIPLGFYGEDIPAAVRTDVVSPAVIAPTLLQRLDAPPASELEPALDLAPDSTPTAH